MGGSKASASRDLKKAESRQKKEISSVITTNYTRLLEGGKVQKPCRIPLGQNDGLLEAWNQQCDVAEFS